MSNLVFKKRNKILGISCGYYFKDILLSRYKNLAIQTLRMRVENLPEEERNKTEEWKVVTEECLKSCERTKKIHEHKQGYYRKIGERVRLRKIEALKFRIQDTRERKEKVISDYDSRINKLQEEINILTNERGVEKNGK
jgi:hypothetical protein